MSGKAVGLTTPNITQAMHHEERTETGVIALLTDQLETFSSTFDGRIFERQVLDKKINAFHNFFSGTETLLKHMFDGFIDMEGKHPDEQTDWMNHQRETINTFLRGVKTFCEKGIECNDQLIIFKINPLLAIYQKLHCAHSCDNFNGFRKPLHQV